MFRSLASSLISLFIVIAAGFLILFIWSGTQAVEFKRVGLTGDKPLEIVIAENTPEAVDVPDDDMDDDEDKPDMAVQAGPAGGDSVVLWLSVPGFRGDYLEKANTPLFDAIDGGSTNKLVPHFPCLTFPAHATLATGRDVVGHGIPSDRFRLEDGTIADHPTDGKLLTAEPIWTTATRQGLRVLVHDWPLSQNQEGEHAAAHFLTSYNAELTDQQRLDAVYEAWSGDSDPKSLRLVMARLNDLNLAGMRNGPTDGGTHEAVTALDKMVGEFLGKLTENWATLAKPDAKLVVVLSTDHGLAPMEKNINLIELLKPTPAFKFLEKFDILSSRSMANLYFKELPPEGPARDAYIAEIDRELESKLYWRTFSPEKLPESWNYTSTDGRIGDRVIVLKRGYGFTDAVGSEPVFDPAEGEGFFASYGYPVEDSSRMKGQLMIWSPNGTSPVSSLDEPDTTQLHPTVCKILGIEPAEGVTAASLAD
jgi:hypothetical protein